MSDKVKITIDRNLCTGCGFCIKFCPVDVLDESDDLNQYDNYFPEVIDKDACIKCRKCELYCPDFAISVEVEEG